MRRRATGELRTAFFKMILGLLGVALPLAGRIPSAEAWGPHSQITRAAIEVLPRADEWKARLGTENVEALASYCLLPDQRAQDLGAFYADDYLLIREMPYHIGHTMPKVEEAFAPYFRRAVQAFRTETPVNACRQLGPLVHFVEDAGAPPHAKEKCPYHKELENWLRAEEIVIAGYKPRLLGTTDEEALAGLMRRMAGLVEFSKARAERALPLVEQAEPDRARVEPILLESALESARATADVIYTVFTLGLAPQADGASLSGTVTAAPIPSGDGHGARVVLLDTDYATLATTESPGTEGGYWKGRYEFRHLPPGTYRVLVYRTASQFRVSEPITLKANKATHHDVALTAAEPAGNIVENPTGRLSYLQAPMPDRWKASGLGTTATWASPPARVDARATYRCGAVVKDPEAKVTFQFVSRPDKDGKTPAPMVCSLELGSARRGELMTKLDGPRVGVVVQVRSSRPLVEAIENVWVVPEVAPPATPAAGRKSPGLTIGAGNVLLHEGRPFRGIGVNYFDALQRRLLDPQDTSAEKGFKALAEAKIPFVRMMGCGFWPVEQKLYRENTGEFFRRFDAVVAAAERHGVGIIPSLFWTTSTVPDLVGEPVGQWGNPASKTHAYMRDYVRDVVGRYKNSPAIWGWEFGNEYNLGANLPNAASHRPPAVPRLGTPKTRSARDEWTNEDIRVAFAAFGREVRRYDPARIISTGNSRPRASAWHNWREGTWKPDTPEQTAEMLILGNPDPVSVMSIHAYDDCLTLVGQARAVAERARKPLFVGEFGAAGHSEATRKEFFALLEALERARVPLAALWVFDYARQTDWSVTATNPRAYQLEAIAAANARIREGR